MPTVRPKTSKRKFLFDFLSSYNYVVSSADFFRQLGKISFFLDAIMEMISQSQDSELTASQSRYNELSLFSPVIVFISCTMFRVPCKSTDSPRRNYVLYSLSVLRLLTCLQVVNTSTPSEMCK